MSLVLPPQAMLPCHNSSDTDRVADAATSRQAFTYTRGQHWDITINRLFYDASESMPE